MPQEDVIYDDEVDNLNCHKFKYASKTKILRRLLFQNQFYETFFMDIFPKFMDHKEVWQFLMDTYEEYSDISTHPTFDDNSSMASCTVNTPSPMVSMSNRDKHYARRNSATEKNDSSSSIEFSSITSDASCVSSSVPNLAVNIMAGPKETKHISPLHRSMNEVNTTSIRERHFVNQQCFNRRSITSLSSTMLDDMDRFSMDSNAFSEMTSGHRKVDFAKYGARIHPAKQALRLINLWVNDYYDDFQRDPDLMAKFTEFYELLMTNHPMEFDMEVKKIKRSYTNKDEEAARTRPYSTPEYVNNISDFQVNYFDKCAPECVALGFTMIDYNNWCALKSRDLIDENYRSHKNRLAVVRIYDLHDQLYTRVFASIACTPSKSDRAKKFRFWTKVTESLVRLHNYNSSIAIYKSLSGNVMNKMPKTTAKLNKKSLDAMDALKVVLGSGDKLKKDLKALTTPYIPFLNDIANTLKSYEQCYRESPDKSMIDLRVCYAISSVICNVRKQKGYRAESYISSDDQTLISGFYKIPCPSVDYILEHLDDKEKLIAG